jgi:hypothetical protein
MLITAVLIGISQRFCLHNGGPDLGPGERIPLLRIKALQHLGEILWVRCSVFVYHDKAISDS